jgi:hypothetical protein
MWAIHQLQNYGGHVQPITGDEKYPGIPDLSAGISGMDIWAEVKLYTYEHDVYDKLCDVVAKGRKVTAQQKNWLALRARAGNSVCGILFGWRTAHQGQYVSFIPIQDWEFMQGMTLAALILSKYTDTLGRLSDVLPLHQLIISASTSHITVHFAESVEFPVEINGVLIHGSTT